MSICAVHGCDHAVYKPRDRTTGMRPVLCRKHYIARLSGRVGANYRRDIHNFHRKGHCEGPGLDGHGCNNTAYSLGMMVLALQGAISPRIRDIIRAGMQILQGDHIDGRESDTSHHAENIQTLCPTCHRVKTVANKDYIPTIYR